MKTEIITSLQNPRIKNVIRLQKQHERRKQQLFIIEGAREMALAVSAGYTLNTLFICRERVTSMPLLPALQTFEVSAPVFEKIAYRENSDGLLALAVPKFFTLGELKPGRSPLYIVLESVEKPGNLGAILRTADAAAVDAVIICNPHTDIYNPNVVRSSVGCLFTNTVISCTSEEALSFFRKNNITVFATSPADSCYYHTCDYTVPSAIIMGTESTGLTDFWLKNAHYRIKIPMMGKIDSLNVSNAAAIMIFEAARQRGFPAGEPI